MGLIAVSEGVLHLTDSAGSFFSKWLLGVVLTAGGASFAAGFLTPYIGILVGLCYLGFALSWFPASGSGIHGSRLMALETVITAVSIALLGPGAYSIDGRLFGRREIIIPRASRQPKL